jgi:D-beta-D-heptose 7-phosphate kinase/D-beta-D-heptose 1-phosphate adenosyltransferase
VPVDPRALSGLRVAVIGDVMLDRFLVGRASRLSPEAPVPVVQLEREYFRLGGAANVAANIQSLGGRAALIGLAGRDQAADMLRETLAGADIASGGVLTDDTRPTTEKMRAVTERHFQVARIDRESSAPATGTAAAALVAAIEALADVRAIVLSDYAKGVVTPEIVAAAGASAASLCVPLLVDPKHLDAARYRGASVVTPNQAEAEQMSGLAIRSDADAARAAQQIAAASGASVVITRGEHGMCIFDLMDGAGNAAHIPAAAREVADVTGAGDTVIAALALGLAAGASLADAAELANRAAGIAVARFGTATVSTFDLESR